MYLRPVHTDLHLPTLYDFLRENPLGIFTTAIQNENFPLIQSSHIPWVLDTPDEEAAANGAIGTLRGHIARANPQTKALIEAVSKSSASTNNASPASKNGVLEQDVMVLFNGPVHHYVTPKFYTTTKPTTGKVVPTWDYSAVQAYGKARLFFDTSVPETGAFISTQIDALSQQSEERSFGYTGRDGQPTAWSVDEAPASYVALLAKAIIGIEIELSSLAGKFKMSQELADGDREGTIRGFEELGTPVGDEMARTVREREAVMRDAKAAA